MKVAPKLLGALVHHDGVLLRVVETEAYLGPDDAASHARSGPTKRCRAMYGPTGRVYIYRSYGVHLCFNIVCHRPETGGAVLIRAGTILQGHELARRRRDTSKGLADGPGKLAQCLNLTPDLDGSCLFEGPIKFTRTVALESRPTILCGPRIGISQNTDKLYRFWIAECPDVSKPRTEGILYDC